MLTGQIEQAIMALFRANMLTHAVHVAILAYQLKLLVLSEKISAEICKRFFAVLSKEKGFVRASHVPFEMATIFKPI